MIPLVYNDESIIYENYIRSTNFIEINLKNYLEFSKTFLFESNKLHKWKNLFDSYFEKQASLVIFKLHFSRRKNDCARIHS